MPQDPSAMRASDADRERTTDVLKAAVAEGRLQPEEYEDRLGAALTAQTYAELDRLVVDLPAGPAAGAGQTLARPGTGAWAGKQVQRPLRDSVNGLAVGSFVTSLAAGFTGFGAIVAIILGHLARRQIRETGERGDGFAIAGLVLGYAQVALGALVLLGLMIAVASSGVDPGSPPGP
jgi:hypothetical protein